nr:MAG TPA: hypothetical protein [Caudoviricetes sp.]
MTANIMLFLSAFFNDLFCASDFINIHFLFCN